MLPHCVSMEFRHVGEGEPVKVVCTALTGGDEHTRLMTAVESTHMWIQP